MTEADALAKVRTVAANLSLPQLSAVELQTAAYEHHDATTKGARAQDIAQVLEGDARQDWIQRRELDYLRAGIAASTPELVRLMKETREPAVKGAILEAIYGAIAKAYPALAQVAAQVAARKKEELAISEPPPSISRKGVAVALEIEESAEPAALSRHETHESFSRHESIPRATESSHELVESSHATESVEDELRRIANLQFLCLCQVNDLASLCEKRGITLSPALQIALLENMLLEAYRTGLHKKVPLILDSIS